MRNSALILLAVCLMATSCSKYEKVMKSTDINYKLTEGMAYYENKKYSKANSIFESLIPLLKGTKSFEGLYYRYAYSFYYMKEWVAASYHFKNFVDFFPASAQADEMEFMHASTLFKMSSEPTLDQSSTIKAMEAMSNYISMHQNSTRLKEANDLIMSGRKKLEAKDAQAAKLYYDIGHYKAATVSYKSVMSEYPESPQTDLYIFMIGKAWYKYAEQSIPARQAERYNNAITEMGNLKAEFPQSTFIKEADLLTQRANHKLQTLQTN